MSPKILMMPSWYPTQENPINGSFFKEQALLMCEKYYFCVVIYDFKYLSLKKYFKNIFLRKIKFQAEIIEKQENYIEVIYRSFLPKKTKISIVNKFIEKFIIMSKTENHEVFLNFLKNDMNFIPNILYAMTAQVNAALTADIAKKANIPLVLAEHAPFPLPNTVLSDETKKAIEHCDRLLVVSHDKARQILMQNINCQPIVVGNLVNEDVFTLKPTKRNQNIFNILIVAAFNFYKDYPTFFKTIRYLRDNTNIEFQVTVIGFNPNNNTGSWTQDIGDFLKLIEQNGISDICTLIPAVNRSDIVSYYHNADVFVMTSIQEGLPVSALEASCCGLPVYSTRAGGVEDYITDFSGKIYQLRDYQSIALGLKNLLEKKVSYDKKKIRKHVIGLYGKKSFQDKLDRIFNELLNEQIR